MAAPAFEIRDDELRALNTRLNRMLARVKQPEPAMEQIAGLLESQTKGRFQGGDDEKHAPDGSPWAEWSPNYAATRTPGVHSLLINKGLLEGDIAGDFDDTLSRVSASLEYALTHQFGDESRGIHARPYMGLSAANAKEIEQTMGEWIEAQL